MKKNILLFISVLTFIQLNSQTKTFNSLLQRHVSKKGNVSYKAFKKDEAKLDKYLSFLNKTSPNKNWSTNKQKAFWINVYNAYTIKLILENYPLKSIIDINYNGKTAWKIPFVKVGGKAYTLDFVEHEILRKKLFDPRIHVGVNCASVSCPKLLNSAFTEKNIEDKLNQLMKEFINDATKNIISKKKVYLSKIFEWFINDFNKNGTLIDYLNIYSNKKITADTEVNYLKYNWLLNGK